MGQAEVSTAIESHMAVNWVESEVAYPNVQFQDGLDEFVRLNISYIGSRQASIGGPRNVHRFFGMAIIQIFVPINTGTKRVNDLTDVVKQLFTAKQFQGITFSTPDPIVVGDDGYGKFQVNVNCPFYYDEII